jgi:hypothetical protein
VSEAIDIVLALHDHEQQQKLYIPQLRRILSLLMPLKEAETFDLSSDCMLHGQPAMSMPVCKQQVVCSTRT